MARTIPLLPSGTVTFLFTDIEGSTQLWEQHPSAMPGLLDRHTELLEEAIADHSGVVFKAVGDSLHAAFTRASAAVGAALAAQRALGQEVWQCPCACVWRSTRAWPSHAAATTSARR
jgi:class 3 adenylate cyclase